MDARAPLPAVRRSPLGHRFLAPAAPFRLAVALLAVAVLALAGGCSEPVEPVARVEAQPATISLPFPRSADLDLTWDLRADIETAGGQPTVFLHLLDEDGQVMRTFDHPFPHDWRTGAEVSYPLSVYQSMLGPPLPRGRYRLTLGLYEGDQRWPLDAGEPAGRMEYEVARVEVPAVRPGELPQVEYFGRWTPLVGGADRQVLGYRLLGGEGQVKVGEVRPGGTLGMVFELTEPKPGQERVMDDGGEVPSLRVVSSCDGSQRTLSGPDPTKLEIQVPAGRACDVDISPNYHFSGGEAGGETGDEAAAGSAGDEEEFTSLARLTVVTWDPAGS
jgi:hypothetical protein